MKTGLITGASSGICQETSRQLLVMKRIKRVGAISLAAGFSGLFYTLIYAGNECGFYFQNCSDTEDAILTVLGIAFGLALLLGVVLVSIVFVNFVYKKLRSRKAR